MTVAVNKVEAVEMLTAALIAFVAIVPVELPDKTFIATLVLSTRYRPLPVYVGVLAAFGVQCLIAVLGRCAGVAVAASAGRVRRGGVVRDRCGGAGPCRAQG
jgi:hypothetical protein